MTTKEILKKAREKRKLQEIPDIVSPFFINKMLKSKVDKYIEELNLLKKEMIDKIEENVALAKNGIKELKGDDGKDYLLTEDDKKEIANKIKVPIVKQIIEKREVIKEQPINNIKEIKIENPVTGKEIVDKVNDAKNKVLIKSIKDLPEELEKLQRSIREKISSRSSSKSGGGGMGNTQHESKSVSSATTSVTTTYKIAAKGYAIMGVYYQGQMVARGVGYTVSSNRKTINLLFTPVDGTFIDLIYIR